MQICFTESCFCWRPFVVAEDLKLNSTLFAWPQNIEAILELSNARITNRRERAEEELKNRVVESEERLNELSKEIDVFRRKEVCLTASLDV